MHLLEAIVPAFVTLLLALAGYLKMRSTNAGLRKELDTVRSERAPRSCADACIREVRSLRAYLAAERKISMPAGTAPPDPWKYIVDYHDRCAQLLAEGKIAALRLYVEEQAPIIEAIRLELGE